VADPIVGIDLGTSNSVVAVCDQGGNVKVLSDDAGFKVQPSVVSFHPNGAVIVGSEAKQRKVLDPKNTVYSAKRLIGRAFRSREVQTTIGRMPYVINEGANQAPMIVTRAGEFAVPEISAIVLDHMRKLASRALGAEVGRAVVTVPASFTEAQRTSTATAGAIAGMTIVRVLNEPTAAALAYGHTRQLRRTIAVYDFGGGTFDITVLKLDDNVYEVLGTSGDTFLGGDDIDERVVDQLVEGFLAQHRIDLRQNEIAMMRLRAVAEQTKIELSRRSRAIIKVDEIAYGPGGAPLNLQQELTRDQLVAGCVDVVDRTFPVCDDALKLAGLRTPEIDDIVLVGGTTKMPYVRDRVAAYFGKAPRTDINPEEAVAIGAALQAAALERLLSKRPSVRATGSMAPMRAPADDETTGGGEITHADELPPDGITLERPIGGAPGIVPGPSALDALPSIGDAADSFIGENAQTKPGEARTTAPLAGAVPPSQSRPGLGGNPNAKSQPGLRNPASQSQSGIGGRPPNETRPGDRPVARGEAIDRFEDRGNVIPPGAPIARMTKSGPAPAPGKTLHGLPSQMLPPEQAPSPPGRPMTAPPPIPGQVPPPIPPGRRTSNLGAIPPSAPGAPLTTLDPMLTPAPGIPASQSQSGLGPKPSASQPGLGPKPPPITAPGVVPPPRGVQPAQFTEIPTKPADVIRALEEPTRPAAAGLEELLLQTDIATKPAGANLERLIRETEPPPRPPGPEPGAVPIFDPLSGMISAPTPAPALIAPTAAAAAPTMIITPQVPPGQTMRGRVDGPAASQGLGSTAKGVPPPPDAVPNLLVPNIIDVTPRAFGIATVAGYCEELIRRNQRLPTETRKTFITSRDRQQVVRIRICQGESRRLDDNVVIGDLVLENLEARPRGETSIEVTFAIDASGILNVRARDVRSGREQHASLDIIGAQSADEVAVSRDRLQQMRR
jgi:molecular chaperone DnaK